MEHASNDEPLLGPIVGFFQSSVGSKVVMSLTGIGMWMFVTGHMAGNLTAYLGHDSFNAYAAALHEKPALLWFVRCCLLLGVPLHFLVAGLSTRKNSAARPTPYAYASRAPARLAAKTMILSGLVVGSFLLYHLAHFTLHYVGPMPAQPDPYAMLVMGFQNPVIAVFYVVAQVLLAMHLSHGIYSMVQHLGFWGKAWSARLKTGGQILAYGTCTLFSSIPLCVLLGFIK